MRPPARTHAPPDSAGGFLPRGDTGAASTAVPMRRPRRSTRDRTSPNLLILPPLPVLPPVLRPPPPLRQPPLLLPLLRPPPPLGRPLLLPVLRPPPPLGRPLRASVPAPQPRSGLDEHVASIRMTRHFRRGLARRRQCRCPTTCDAGLCRHSTCTCGLLRRRHGESCSGGWYRRSRACTFRGSWPSHAVNPSGSFSTSARRSPRSYRRQYPRVTSLWPYPRK